MWIFNSDGFFSVVKHKTEPGVLVVRSRVKADLEMAFGKEDISETDYSDYRFRKEVPHAAVAEYLFDSVMDIDYTNVKDNIDLGEDDRHKMLYEVWNAHNKLQTSRYGSQWPDAGEYDNAEWFPYQFEWKDKVPA